MLRRKHDVILTIGHNVNGTPTLARKQITTEALKALSIDGLTAYGCTGYWRGEAEESTRIEICAVSAREARRIRNAIPALAKRLGQVEIMVQITPSRTRFVKAA